MNKLFTSAVMVLVAIFALNPITATADDKVVDFWIGAEYQWSLDLTFGAPSVGDSVFYGAPAAHPATGVYFNNDGSRLEVMNTYGASPFAPGGPITEDANNWRGVIGADIELWHDKNKKNQRWLELSLYGAFKFGSYEEDASFNAYTATEDGAEFVVDVANNRTEFPFSEAYTGKFTTRADLEVYSLEIGPKLDLLLHENDEGRKTHLSLKGGYMFGYIDGDFSTTEFAGGRRNTGRDGYGEDFHGWTVSGSLSHEITDDLTVELTGGYEDLGEESDGGNKVDWKGGFVGALAVVWRF